MKQRTDDPGFDAASSKAKLVGRRKLMKALATGGGVAVGAALIPSRWTAPIVESVGLPAHAQTSGTILGDQLLLAQLHADAGGPSLEKLADLLVPRAEAVATPQPGEVDAILDGCIFLTFDGDFVQATLNGPFFSDSGGLSGVSTNAFTIDVGPYQVKVHVAPDSLPTPDTAAGQVICTNGYFDYVATPGKADCAVLRKIGGP